MLTRNEKILLFGATYWNFANGLLGPLLAVFAQRIGGDILAVSSASAIYLIVTGICVILIGRWSDRCNKAMLLTIGYALTTCFTFLYLVVDSSLELLLVQAGLGVALAFSNPTWSALFDQYSQPSAKGYLWGLSDGAMKIANGLAIIIGGLIVSYTSFTVLFIVMGCCNLFTTLYQAQMLLKTRKRT